MHQRHLFRSPAICILFLFCALMRLTGSLPFSLGASCLICGAGTLADYFST